MAPMGIIGHWWILLIILALALVLLSPSILPRLGRRLGRGLRETKDASIVAAEELKREVAAKEEDPGPKDSSSAG